MGQDYDVIVIGAGPGGSTSAAHCARSGLKTLLIDREKFPRYKPCGGCLSLKSVQLLDLDFGSVIENTIYGVKFTFAFGEPFLFQSGQPIAFLVMRDRFDEFLARKAAESGAQFLDGEAVRGIKEEGSGIEVELARGETLRTQFVIGADGPLSVVARSISLLSPNGHRNGIGLTSEIPFEAIANPPEKASPFIHLDFGSVPNGYGWIFPKKDVLSIGIGGLDLGKKSARMKSVYASFLRETGYVEERGSETVRSHPLPSFYDERQRISRGKILLVGDAAHLMDPLMGEGIYYALRSGRLAAESILLSKAEGVSASETYQTSVQNEIFHHLKWALTFSRFAFRFPRLAFEALKRHSDLADHYLRVLEGKEDYHAFVSSVKKRIGQVLGGRLTDRIKKEMARS